MMFAIAVSVFSISCIQLAISQCPQNCQECSDTNQCLSCKVGHWGASFNCLNTCSNNCAHSNCDDNGYCYACVTGKYGPNCNHECRLCQNEECGLRECTSGCKSGYFQDTIKDYSYCSPCQVNCQRCLNFTYCTLCDVGYYIYKYKFKTEPKMDFARCTTCQSKNLCDQCLQLPNFSQCSYNNNGEIACKHCIEGNTLDNQQCVENNLCPSSCLNGCTPDGICHGCRDGRTGYRCDYLCGSTCSKCLRTDQMLCLSCKHGFYTTKCDMYCPQNCATRQCDFNNGSCIGGCLPGFWGDRCEDKCSDHCTLSECNRDGTCSLGCTAAYDGLYCNITRMTTKTTLTSSLTSEHLPFNTRSQSYSTTIKTTVLSLSTSSEIGVSTVCNSQEDSFSFGSVLGGAVTGAVIITALLVGSIAYFLHQRTVSRISNREQRTDTMYYNTVGRSSVYEDAGQNINKASEMWTTQTPEISVYDQLSRQNTEHVYNGL